MIASAVAACLRLRSSHSVVPCVFVLTQFGRTSDARNLYLDPNDLRQSLVDVVFCGIAHFPWLGLSCTGLLYMGDFCDKPVYKLLIISHVDFSVDVNNLIIPGGNLLMISCLLGKAGAKAEDFAINRCCDTQLPFKRKRHRSTTGVLVALN